MPSFVSGRSYQHLELLHDGICVLSGGTVDIAHQLRVEMFKLLNKPGKILVLRRTPEHSHPMHCCDKQKPQTLQCEPRIQNGLSILSYERQQEKLMLWKMRSSMLFWRRFSMASAASQGTKAVVKSYFNF